MIMHKVGERSFALTFTPNEMNFLRNVDVCDVEIRDMTLEVLQAMIMYRILFLLGGKVSGVGEIPEDEPDGDKP